jgi:hypothetical protein
LLFPLATSAQQGSTLGFTKPLQEPRKALRVELLDRRFLHVRLGVENIFS